MCQLGKGSWPKEHNGIADWKLRGHGLNADLLVCGRCRAALMKSGLMYGNPFVAMASLVRAGVVNRPSVHAYLQHPEWRKVSMHVLDIAGATVPDEFAALEALKAVEVSLFGTDPRNTGDFARGRAEDDDDDDDEDDDELKESEPYVTPPLTANAPGICPVCSHPISRFTEGGAWDGFDNEGRPTGGALYRAHCTNCSSVLRAAGPYGAWADTLTWALHAEDVL